MLRACQIMKRHSCLAHKDPELKLLNLLEEKRQVQIKEGRVREAAGLNAHSQLREGQCSRATLQPPSQMARLELQVLILAWLVPSASQLVEGWAQ